MIKRNDGFTLVELLCAIVAGSIVTAATATILLLGLRLNANATNTATRDNQVVIGLSVLGDLAKENDIEVTREATGAWSVKDKTGNVLYSYQSGNPGAICVSGNTPLIENVQAASIDGPDATGLLKIVLTVDDEQYPLAVYCRMFTPTEPSTP